MAGIQIGQVLVEQGVLTHEQVQHILVVQKHSHRPFGDLAERLYGIHPRHVEDAWVEQYVRTAGVEDLEGQQVDEECLRVLNRRQAWQFHLLPLHRDQHATLNMASSPEGLVRALNFATHTLGEPVLLKIAERSQLQDFLMKHYPVPQYLARYAATL